MDNLKITVIQPDIIWERPEANLAGYNEMIKSADKSDLIILPEMFSTGFTMQPEKIAENMDGVSVHWMKTTAMKNNCIITGSLIIRDEHGLYNRCLWVLPDGSIDYYDKKHLFTMSGEHLHYSAGKSKLVTEYKGWRFCPLICYDLRFPVWSRNAEGYDILIYMANWPSSRHLVWKSLLVARAIENQSYCIGVNRVGTDGNGLHYNGDSVLVDPKGNPDFLGGNELIKTFELSYRELHDFRKKFPVLQDRDKFILGGS